MRRPRRVPSGRSSSTRASRSWARPGSMRFRGRERGRGRGRFRTWTWAERGGPDGQGGRPGRLTGRVRPALASGAVGAGPGRSARSRSVCRRAARADGSLDGDLLGRATGLRRGAASRRRWRSCRCVRCNYGSLDTEVSANGRAEYGRRRDGSLGILCSCGVPRVAKLNREGGELIQVGPEDRPRMHDRQRQSQRGGQVVGSRHRYSSTSDPSSRARVRDSEHPVIGCEGLTWDAMVRNARSRSLPS